jgi:hypothetical protein
MGCGVGPALKVLRGRLSVNVNLILALSVAAGLALSGCSGGPKGVRVTNNGTSAFTDKQGESIRDLSASDIRARIVGKTFQYTRKEGNGFVTYNADGSFDFQDDVKGEGRGAWAASGSQYCETFGPGAAQECGVFKTTGDAYFAANSRLVEMKI